MTNNAISGIATAMAFVVISGALQDASANTLRFHADLTGGGETPPSASLATGHMEATFDTAANTLTWSCTYSNLSGVPIGAHFDGPVSYVGATADVNTRIEVGTPGNLSSPFSSKATIDATQAQDLKSGLWTSTCIRISSRRARSAALSEGPRRRGTIWPPRRATRTKRRASPWSATP